MAKKTIIIVESPTKAKTIGAFLGKEYTVISSMGHIRDLPKSKIGIDPDNNFAIDYSIPTKAKKTVTELKRLAKDSSEVILATDEDREGEAISWHLAHILKLNPKTAKRMVFHEITKNAIMEALSHPRTIDLDLVDAQQARRALDRLVGYKLSPFLWQKVQRGLSAGRVQSVALRLIVDREREIDAFIPQEYWTIMGSFSTKTHPLHAELTHINGKKLDKFAFGNEDSVKDLVEILKKSSYIVHNLDKKETKRNPYPPFKTSTLQQDAARRLHFSSKQTMMVAQQLYEGISLGSKGQKGLITYMRTDSTNLSNQALDSAQKEITARFGKEYHSRRVFSTKAKNAQEAHEAIRPTDPTLFPEEIKQFLDDKQYRLYRLIWSRFMASQMSAAVYDSTNIGLLDDQDHKYLFTATGKVLKFPGFLKVYDMSSDDILLPEVLLGEILNYNDIKGEQHFTQPPARYNESTLVKALETHSIGRPSTYASIISTIQDRKYVDKNDDRRFIPTEIGVIVTDMLVEHFPSIVDIDFTARVEDQFDQVAQGEETYQQMLSDFYRPFISNLEIKEQQVEHHRELLDRTCPQCGHQLELKRGRFGKFIACTHYPECTFTDKTDEEKQMQVEFGGEKCPNCIDGIMEVKQGRFGSFLGCSNYPECKTIKKIERKTGEICPKCSVGELIWKKSKRGDFKACNRYPDCDYIEGKKSYTKSPKSKSRPIKKKLTKKK